MSIHTDVNPGTRIEDLTIAYRIRQGMSADVFAVWHHGLRTPLICKRLRPEDAGNIKWRKMLRQEALVLKKISHPGVVRLIEAQTELELPYFLLEHVAEKTLRDELLESGPLQIDRAVRVVQHVGAAVAYLHDAGYLHRDIKPSNIMMRQGRPILLDFGIVWQYRTGKRPTDRSGTPQYLAPEQILQQPLCPATDVFGLGVLLFELLTGSRPFEMSEAYKVRDAPLNLRYTQLAVSAPLLRKSGCRAPRALETLMQRCLASESRNRYQHVAELLRDLDAFTKSKIWPRKHLLRHVKAFEPFSS